MSRRLHDSEANRMLAFMQQSFAVPEMYISCQSKSLSFCKEFRKATQGIAFQLESFMALVNYIMGERSRPFLWNLLQEDGCRWVSLYWLTWQILWGHCRESRGGWGGSEIVGRLAVMKPWFRPAMHRSYFVLSERPCAESKDKDMSQCETRVVERARRLENEIMDSLIQVLLWLEDCRTGTSQPRWRWKKLCSSGSSHKPSPSSGSDQMGHGDPWDIGFEDEGECAACLVWEKHEKVKTS